MLRVVRRVSSHRLSTVALRAPDTGCKTSAAGPLIAERTIRCLGAVSCSTNSPDVDTTQHSSTDCLRRVVSCSKACQSHSGGGSIYEADQVQSPATCTTKLSRERAMRISSVVWSSLPCDQVSQSLVYGRRTWRVYIVNLPRSAKRSERNTLIQLSLALSLS